jgi:small-conductance mechanosensitive channel
LPDINLSFDAVLGLVITWVICIVLVLDIVWLMPKLLRYFFRWADLKAPLQLAELEKPVFRILAITLSAIVLFGGAVATAGILGFDISWARDSARDAGIAIATWLGPRVARIAIILAIGLLAMRACARLLPPLISRYLSRRGSTEGLPGEAQKREQTLSRAAISTVNVLVATLVFFIILSELGINLAPLLAAAGVIGIAIGFGAQSLVRDFFSGIFILLEDQYRVGDVVQVGDTAGLVEDINLRRTVLRDLDFIVHSIPNGEVRVASNFTKEKSRVNMNVSVAYKEDLDVVIAEINRVGQEMSQDSYFGPLIRDPLKVLRVDAFEQSGIAIKVIGETLPIRQWEVAGEFRRRIKRAFDEKGITIPFPHLTVYWGTGVETHIRQLVEDTKMDERPLQPAQDRGNTQTQ